MKLFVDGFWQILVIDDVFPVVAENGKQYLVEVYHDKKQYYWANLIIKGLAKVMGGYDQLNHFSSIDYIHYFTGKIYL